MLFSNIKGDNPRISKNTSIRLNPKKGLKKGHWSAGLKVTEVKQVEVEVLTSSDSIIGKWRLTVKTSCTTADRETKMILKYQHKEPVYLLFNPWCKGKITKFKFIFRLY